MLNLNVQASPLGSCGFAYMYSADSPTKRRDTAHDCPFMAPNKLLAHGCVMTDTAACTVCSHRDATRNHATTVAALVGKWDARVKLIFKFQWQKLHFWCALILPGLCVRVWCLCQGLCIASQPCFSHLETRGFLSRLLHHPSKKTSYCALGSGCSKCGWMGGEFKSYSMQAV